MKNFLLFNQSFGTVGSPNQTDETLTRENRIGLKSYLRRTLMLLFAVLVMSVANVGTAWGATVSEGTHNFVNQSIASQHKFYKIANGIYQYRLDNYAKGTLGIQLPSGTSDGTGFVFHLESTQKVYIGLCKKNVKSAVENNLYIKSITKANFDAIEAGTNNSTTVTLTLAGSATLSQDYTFAAIGSAKTEGATVYMGELPAGYYYAYGNSTSGNGYLYSISFGTQTLFLVPNDKTDNNAKFAIYYFPGPSGYECQGWSDYMTVSPCNSSTYRADIPKGYTKVIFVRLNPSGGRNWDSKWNQTGNLTFDGTKDLFTWANDSWDGATTTWSASTKYTISFASNGGSGSMSNVSSIACGRSVKLAANAYTKSGYVFAGWKTNVAVTANGEAVAANGIVADEATISNITSNITLTAQWNADVACTATQPGALSKGTLSGCSRTITASGSPETNTTWYWQSSASGTDKTDAYSSGKAITEAGTYYLRSFCSDGSGCWSDAVQVTITAADMTPAAPTALAKSSVTAKGVTLTVTDDANTNDYEFYVNTSSSAPSAGTSASYTSTSKSVTITDKYAGTTFYAWARAKCGSNKSAWTALGDGGTFTTSTVSAAYHLTNVSKTSGAESGIGGSTFTAVFSANTDYSMPTPVVTIGGNTATSGTDYTWTAGTGTLTIAKEKITGNIDITLNSVPSAPTSATISGTYHYFPGENISLTVTPSGNNGPTTYQWYKGGKENGNAIEGATSATFTKNSCAFEDAGSYYCKVTCNATSIWANTNSSENYDVKILRLYVNGSKGGVPYGNVDFEKVNSTTATASISLGSNWTYGFNIADGCGHYYGNAGTMQYNSCTNWTTNVPNTDCGLTTTNAATYTFTINYSNLGAIVTSVTFPVVNQAAGKVIYFDNNVLKWTGSSIYYRIGHSSHSQADQLSLVPGTANLYKMTTREYNGFFAWQIGNAEGGNGSGKSIYNTKNTPAITASVAYEGASVTADAVTVTPGTDHSTGGDAQNNNCEFYSKTITNGMKRDRVTITAPVNGTITVNYTSEENVASSFSATTVDMYQDLAHTVKLTSITAVANTGYDAGAITINGDPYSANYVVTGNTTIAATFTPHVYSITYLDQGGSAFSGTHTDTPSAHPTSHTYNTATNLNGATKAGYTFGGWYTSSDCSTGLVTTLGATAYTADITLYAKWTEDVAPCPTGGDIFTLVMDYSSSSATKVPANSTLAWSDSYGDVDGGTVTLGNKHASSTDHMQVVKTNILKFGGNDGYVKIDLDCPLKTGDIISFTSEETNQISFTKTDTRATSPATSNKKWTVTAAYNNVSTIYLWRASGSTVNLHTINITRPVTVTFDKNGGSSVSPTSTTYDGTAEITLPEPVRADYRCTGWNTAIGGDGTDLGLPGETYRPNVTTNTQTIYAQWEAMSCESGTLYKFLTKTDLTNGDLSTKNELFYVKTSNYLANLTGGRLQAFANGSNLTISDNKNFKFSDNSSYLLLTLDCPLRATDHMKWKVSSQDLVITKTSTRATTITLTKGDGDVAVPEGLVGATQLWIWKGSSSGGKISYFEIIRSASTYNVTYDGNDQTSAAGTVPTDATNYAYNATVTTAAQGSLAKTNYTFGGWNTANDGTGTNTAAGSTFSITDNTTLYAKWTQAVTFDANMANHGSAGGSATAVWNATALTGITHATPASGYKLLGYYTTASGAGVKVLNSDGSFAATNVTDYITSGKWSRTDEAPTLYARYESSGSLIWNLGVNTDATSLTTSSKNSDFPQIAVANMTNAALTGISYSQNKKSELTGIIETPTSYDGAKYVSVTFQVAAGYKFTPSSVKVKVQPKDNAKTVKIELSDASSHSQNYTSDSQSAGSIHTVTMTGNGTFYTGTVTLKIYCYGASGGYRLGTPILIEGEVEATCTMPSFDGLNYEETSYSLGDDASAITVTNPANVTTYAWKQNTTNDRSGTTPASGTNNTASYTPPTSAAGTLYYWCELISDCGTVKTPAVAITVNSSKSDATISWTGTSASANYGGGGYTVKATVEQTGWDGDAADLVITAPAGIRIYSIESGETASKKWVQASFDVMTAFDRETYSSTIPFVVTADATASYNAISDEHAVDFDACTGGGGSSEEYMPVDAAHIDNTTWKGGWVYSGIGMMRYSHGGSAVDDGNVKSLAHNMGAGSVITKYYKSSANHFGFYTEKAINGVRLYVYTSNAKSTVSGVYIANSAYASGTPSTGAVTYEATYYNEDDGLLGTTNDGCTWVEITFDSEVAAGKYGQINLSANVNIAGIAFISSSGSGAKLNTHLQWSGSLADGATVNKKTTDAYFTYSASKVTENTNSLGALTYSSSDPSVATVDATGKVAMVAAGTTTVKATLAASGCYKKAEISYTLNVTEVPCAIAAGTLALTSGAESKCSSDNVTLTLTGFESGATLQWKDGDTDINNGGNYTIVTDETTSTLTTNQPGTYSVIVTKDCYVRSNRITISNKSTSVHVTRLVKEWYIKNGRLTPDIALWELGDDCSFVSVTASSGWDAGTGLTEAELGEKVFYEKDGIVYLKGTEPKANAGAVQNYTLTLTVDDGCSEPTLSTADKQITIHHQQNTDKHVLAFVVNGTEKGDWTAGVTAAQTTNVGLYNAIAAQFDVQATNIYATDDEKKLKEYYSQYDILCITDYPNTQTKGANSKSYVDAIGSLIDIRPILTMEAFVSKLANWKAKGISGSPKSPTTRQYTMDLQCKDHEIFARTTLTKVGEGDEAMYRVSMVDNTKEEYVSLDATYGGGAHAEKEGYQYGKKPALQGFTFTQEMSDNDLLPIGLIDDGAGNPLQVGIERQHNMEARLMVLGINSYAMERLTDDGERVVINSLNYLMKKNAEDIADCSTSFVGGYEGDEKNWNNANNWTGNTVPLPSQKVRILADCEVSSTVYALDVLIVTGGKYNHGSDNAAGKLTIKENGALIVGGKIQAASAPAYNRPRATAPADLTIGSNETNGNGTLIFDNEDGSTQAIVQYYSKANTNENDEWNWQYMAVPFNDNSSAYRNYYDSYLYRWKTDCSGWEVVPNRGEVYPWVGYTITQVGAKTYVMDGTLVETGEMEFTVPEGKNLVLGNSWTAPIQVKQFTDDDFEHMSKNVYLFNTGYDKDGTGTFDKADGRYEGGTYVTIPIHSSPYTGDSLISSLQAFIVYAKTGEGGGTFTLDYDRHVRPARSTDKVNAGPMHAPRRGGAIEEKPAVLKVWASGSRYDDRLIVLEREDFSTGLDEGWDGNKRVAGKSSPLIFAVTDNGREAVSAIPTMEGTLIGFWAGEDNEYTLHFEYNEEDELYLLDLDNNTYTPVNSSSTYVFTVPDKKAHNRFILTRIAPDPVATGVEETQASEKPEAKVIKFLKDEKVFIFVNGKLYDATGKVVK